MQFPPLKLVLIAVVLSLNGSFHIGYQLIVVNPSEAVLRNFLNQSSYLHYANFIDDNTFAYAWPALLNVYVVSAFIGSLLVGPLTEKFGRRICFYKISLFNAISYTLYGVSYFAISLELFVVARLFGGIAGGFSAGLLSLYVSEISPTEFRGFLNTVAGVFSNVGCLSASIVGMPTIFGTDRLWHWFCWLPLATVVPAISLLPFLHESPKYLFAKTKDRRLALASLEYFQHDDPKSDLAEIESEINMMVSSNALSLRQILKTPYLRQGLLLGCLIVTGAQMCGINAYTYYSTRLFVESGLNPSAAPYATVAVMTALTLGSAASSLIVDKFGRRPLLLISFGAMIALNGLFIAFSLAAQYLGAAWPGYCLIVITILFVVAFGLGPSTIMWFASSELMPQQARSAVTSCTTAVLYVFMGVSSGAFFPLNSTVGVWSFFMFIVPECFILIYCYFKFPETKNKEILEIITMLGYKGDKISVKDFIRA